MREFPRFASRRIRLASGRLLVLAAFAVLGLIGAVSTEPARAQQDLVSLVRQSGFIFAGRIEEIGAATKGIRAESNTAVVRILRVIDAQPPIDEVKGHEVTVRLHDPNRAKPGQEAVFFSYLYGGGMSLGLEEVAEMPNDEKLDASVHGARLALADAALRARLKSASVVAIATVLRIARVEAPSPRGEHEPMWWNATLKLSAVLKGDAAKGATLTVRFPSNYDAYWGAAPKPQPGDTALFLMQPASAVPATAAEPGERVEKERLTGLFLVDRLDELGADEADRARRILAQ